MGTKAKLGIVLGAAALTFAGLASAIDMGYVDCMAKFEPKAIGGTSDAGGFVLHRQWALDLSKGEGLDIYVEVPVPAKVPGLFNLEQAMKSSLFVTLAHGRTVYAECTADVDATVTAKGLIRYEMIIRSEGSGIKTHGGTCDVDPWAHGVQLGVPIAYGGDVVRAYIVYGNEMTPLTKGVIDVM